MIILSAKDRENGFVRPHRTFYKHSYCGYNTTISDEIATKFAKNPKFTKITYCKPCNEQASVAEFIWADGSGVGT